ncbi:protoporphyrinogen oxidase HemJ [Pararhodospirillum oryzae]|uniref:Protoporphyrinogen IX oxidase n=1 Tax=Pararhodospirillum oryzae TaxID=478448 RepID=A0A512H3T8_9PROT|nr:protoporphyrinogen oxidase HemJ [Pararhodospirillum oryzae]GEO80050.1 membrane protein [Pararhodospirillum oryzae]
MLSFGTDLYLWVKALHVIAVITWMAGLFYLPRLFVYHATEPVGSPTSEKFKVMERRLVKAIMNPSLVVVAVTGPLLMGDWLSDGWLHLKLLMVAGMILMHVYYVRWQKDFAEDRNTRPHVFYRYANEVPTVLMLVIVPLVILKPQL